MRTLNSGHPTRFAVSTQRWQGKIGHLAKRCTWRRPRKTPKSAAASTHAADVVLQLAADPLQVPEQVRRAGDSVLNTSFVSDGMPRRPSVLPQELQALVHVQDREGLDALCDAARSVRDAQHTVVTFSPKARALDLWLSRMPTQRPAMHAMCFQAWEMACRCSSL
jgi:hypothetical protein